jgi:hypothetical protein
LFGSRRRLISNRSKGVVVLWYKADLVALPYRHHTHRISSQAVVFLCRQSALVLSTMASYQAIGNCTPGAISCPVMFGAEFVAIKLLHWSTGLRMVLRPKHLLLGTLRIRNACSVNTQRKRFSLDTPQTTLQQILYANEGHTRVAVKGYDSCVVYRSNVVLVGLAGSIR